ncbi:rod shape-determining protein RodA [Ancylothrix sp. C2]|uniref:rod shape-determining protein RodA n=1 Tax=Ancylothrix sp. D3o TaxID=2953691 RepID=UPI0021BBAFF9|nr:rod shape-determining protein RodA [Ancylothrix sp. D3o]MCT7951244.1 rod shape-determining protein RodA [Ancylothrix sp. D3o]
MWQNVLLRIGRQPALAPWQHIDWILLSLVVGLTALGGVMIRSVELHLGHTDWWQHWITGGIGLTIAMLIARNHYEALIQWKWFIYGFINIALISVRFIGTQALGAQRWINVFGFHVQPSEFAKVGVIITLAALLHNRGATTIPNMLKILAVTAVPWALVFSEPNLGTSLVFGAITMGMLYWGGANPGWLILMLSPVISAIVFNIYFPGWVVWSIAMGIIGWRTLPWQAFGSIASLVINVASGWLGHIFWGLLKDYQKERIILFLDPNKDPLGGGYHLIQSRIAIGAGQIWGKGLTQGTQTQLNFIPEQHTDFIFSAIGEELGFIGCLVVFIAFWLLCLRLVLIAQNAKDNFGSLIAIGVLSMIIFQVVINIGMNIGLAPVTGVPLPLLSYGRSALLSNFIAIGLVESVANFRPRKKY